jgi:hypothetical protein
MEKGEYQVPFYATPYARHEKARHKGFLSISQGKFP